MHPPNVLVLALVLASCTREATATPEPTPALESELETTDKHIEIRLSAAAREALRRQPKAWVLCDIGAGSAVIRNVSIRIKGQRSLRSINDKPSFKLRFDEGAHHEGRRFQGSSEWTLENLVEDPTQLRAHLSYRLAAAVGLPAPISEHVSVTLDGEAKGLYLLVEAPGADFLVRNFGADRGPLYEGEYGCDVVETQLDCFDLESGKDPQQAELGDLARVAAAGGSELWDGDDAPFELDHLATFLAFGAYIGDFDGYVHLHNYRLYTHNQRWWLMSWGLDRVFVEQVAYFDGDGVLATRCFAHATCRERYVAALQQIDATARSLDLHGEVQQLGQQLDERAGIDTSDARQQLQDFMTFQHKHVGDVTP